MYHRHRRNSPTYTLFLLYRLYGAVSALPYKPPITIGLLATIIAIFATSSVSPALLRALPPALRAAIKAARPFLTPRAACIPSLPDHRLLLSALVHVDETHLLYNALSLVHKGTSLESVLPPPVFALLLLYLALASSGLYTLLAVLYPPLRASCAVGLSGVLFGLGAVLSSSRSHREAARTIFRIPVPGLALATLAEVVAAQFLNPHASFMGHLCGALAGLSWVGLTRIFDAANAHRARGGRGYEDFGSGTTGYRHAHGE